MSYDIKRSLLNWYLLDKCALISKEICDIDIETYLCAIRIMETLQYGRTELVSMENFYIFGCSCLHIAYKLIQGYDDDNLYISTYDWIHITNNIFTENDILKWEIKILHQLDYKLFRFTQNLFPTNFFELANKKEIHLAYKEVIDRVLIHTSMNNIKDDIIKNYLKTQEKKIVEILHTSK
jgi:hypothetical protein